MQDKPIQNISKIIQDIGITPNYRGYQYILHCVEIAAEEPDTLQAVTKRLYPRIAKMFNTCWPSVERNIRTIINNVWKNNPEELNNLAGYKLSAKPKPAQFIGIIVSHLK